MSTLEELFSISLLKCKELANDAFDRAFDNEKLVKLLKTLGVGDRASNSKNMKINDENFFCNEFKKLMTTYCIRRVHARENNETETSTLHSTVAAFNSKSANFCCKDCASIQTFHYFSITST